MRTRQAPRWRAVAPAVRYISTAARALASDRPQFAVCQTGCSQGAAHRQPQGSLKRFQAKACPGRDPGWVPVGVKKTRQTNGQDTDPFLELVLLGAPASR